MDQKSFITAPIAHPHALPNVESYSETKKKLIAEFIGTYFLVFAGTGAIIVNSLTESLTHVGVAITFGLVVLALIYSFGHISGAHFNPAVTLAFLALGEITRREAILYVSTQLIAASASSVTLLIMFGNVSHLGATIPSGTWMQSFVLEFVLTFVLMIVILTSAVHSKAVKSFAGMAIGATVALEAMFGGPISGASMNPARSFGPAIVSGTFSSLWIYLVATTLGALSAALIYTVLHEEE
ncbi:aquaporin [Priestia endophytica]|uniref:aquaporin n=1 Tax=Priestia endophytica TaxID=135735 RepID=UPI002280D463|nr:aquaporin [Priestia endophytica]MCY8235354.1 aquaporin [Priestia endophytica]